MTGPRDYVMKLYHEKKCQKTLGCKLRWLAQGVVPPGFSIRRAAPPSGDSPKFTVSVRKMTTTMIYAVCIKDGASDVV